MKGKFITLYGVNNIGKSTHAKRLVKRLAACGIKALYVKYPVYDIEPTGPMLNSVLRGGGAQQIPEEELQLWFTLNRYQNEPSIKKALDEGTWVIAEDYTGTGLSWGAAKGADLQWLTTVNKHLLKEDFSLLIQGKRVLSSRETGHIHEENDELAQKCQDILAQLGDHYNWTKIQLQPHPNDTADLIWAAVNKEFNLD